MEINGKIKRRATAGLTAIAVPAGIIGTGVITAKPAAAYEATPVHYTTYAVAFNSVPMTPERIAVAKTIISVVEARGLSPRAAVIAIDVGLMESTLRNLNWGDGSSAGVFQQTSIWGGSIAQRTNVAWATNSFLNAMVRVPDWQGKSVQSVAYSVQHCAAQYAYRYDLYVQQAQSIVNTYWGKSSSQSSPARYHVVKSGDTLSGLTVHYGTTISHLMAMNSKIGNPDLIYVGWVLRVKLNGHGRLE